MALKLPTPPTPPTIDKGEAVESTPKFDAHKFFEVPFKRENEPVAKDETPTKTPEPVANIEAKPVEPTPEEMAREAVANGAGALTKRTVENVDTPAAAPTTNYNRRDGKAVLREFDSYDDTYAVADTPRSFNGINQREGHGGIFWAVTIIFIAVFSIVFVRKFLVRNKPTDASKRLDKISAPNAAPKNDGKGKRFEVRI